MTLILSCRQSLSLDEFCLVSLHNDHIVDSLARTCLDRRNVELLVGTLDALNTLYQLNSAWNYNPRDGGGGGASYPQPSSTIITEQEQDWYRDHCERVRYCLRTPCQLVPYSTGLSSYLRTLFLK